jgi:hypothetical protein
VKPLFFSVSLLGLTATASFGSVFLSIVTESPNEFCNFSGATVAVSCVSDSGTEGRAAISASPTADGLGFTFTETFDMGPVPFQSFGNVDLLASTTLGNPGISNSYTMTVLEQGTCTSNVVSVCTGFTFNLLEGAIGQFGAFTSTPQLHAVSGFPNPPIVLEVEFFKNHTTVASEHTSISGSLHIESVTFNTVPEPSSGQLALVGVIAVGCWRSLRSRRRCLFRESSF